jgi:hypothetical protein
LQFLPLLLYPSSLSDYPAIAPPVVLLPITPLPQVTLSLVVLSLFILLLKLPCLCTITLPYLHLTLPYLYHFSYIRSTQVTLPLPTHVTLPFLLVTLPSPSSYPTFTFQLPYLHLPILYHLPSQVTLPSLQVTLPSSTTHSILPTLQSYPTPLTNPTHTTSSLKLPYLPIKLPYLPHQLTSYYLISQVTLPPSPTLPPYNLLSKVTLPSHQVTLPLHFHSYLA